MQLFIEFMTKSYSFCSLSILKPLIYFLLNSFQKDDNLMKIISSMLINDLLKKAATSIRRRSHYNFHESAQDPIQRYVVASKIDSYFRPHRHVSKSELAIIFRGKFDLLIFDDGACVTERISLGFDSENIGFELPCNVWHLWIPMMDDSLFLEVKGGPYDPTLGLEFASWSPPEGDVRVTAFLEKMRGLAVGDSAAS